MEYGKNGQNVKRKKTPRLKTLNDEKMMKSENLNKLTDESSKTMGNRWRD